jgi:hypothetical protein
MKNHEVAGIFSYLAETRWIEYAEQWPAHREFVEAVLGRKIDWKTT